MILKENGEGENSISGLALPLTFSPKVLVFGSNKYGKNKSSINTET